FTTLRVNSPSFSGRIVPLFDTMLEHQGEGLGIPTEPHHTPSPKADTSHPTTSSIPLPSISTAPILPVTQPDTTPIRQYTRRARIAQSSALLTVADEPASPVRDVSQGEACPTDSGFIADKDRATIAKSSTFPHDSAPRVTSPAADEGTTVLAGGIDVPTGSGFIPTAGPSATVISTGSEVGPTASPIVTRRKSKEVMVESDTLKKKKLQEQIDAQVARELEEQQEKENMRMNEQIARDAEVARIHAEEELQGMIDSLDKSNETIAKLKRKKEKVKKQKSSKAAPRIETSTEDVTEEKIKEMMQLVPVEDVYVQALQVKHPIVNWKAQEEEIVKLKDKVKVLEDKEDVTATQSGNDAPIKGRSINEGEAAAKRISNDSEEVATVLTSMDAATVLAGGIDSHWKCPIVTRRKDKKVMVESDTPKKKKLQEQIDAHVARELEEQQEKENIRMNEQIARDAEVTRIHVEEELQESTEKANDQEAEEGILYGCDQKQLRVEGKHFKGMTFEEIEAKFAKVWKQVEDFIPIGSKEETERLKRKGLNLEKEQVKKQKLSEEAPEIETSTEEITEEKMKEMM
nr:hypothetical protein [Tanacetum cinerariifolium]